MIEFDREALCEGLNQHFESGPRATKDAAYELAMRVHTVGEKEFVVTLTWGEVVDALIPMLERQELDKRDKP